ncbi:hypothetical protein FA10DRAFT_181215 [Acaromyces ingoldii]|uniref:Uncharacterized protein n=1 Tax=Acaromyces ingoldii TaxID=215250 RepID=A0A316YFI1_9BASI|nr:hypothetical protein FA10DRAFT_181215 [Acaromyces ingoldii]PWN87962.1 hypothetical protein FA10DRAFT_181215 [Acaromyces ingoldii]
MHSHIALDSAETECDRSHYNFVVTVNADVDILHNTTYRFLVGQARHGPQGTFLDGSKVFLDRSYLASQNTGYRPSVASDPSSNFTFIAFNMYNDMQTGELLKNPWVLSTENNTQGTIVPGEFTAVLYINRPEFIPNGTADQMPEPVWKTFTPGSQNGYNCTRALTNTTSLSAAESTDGISGANVVNGAFTRSAAHGLGVSFALVAAGTILL